MRGVVLLARRCPRDYWVIRVIHSIRCGVGVGTRLALWTELRAAISPDCTEKPEFYNQLESDPVLFS